MEREGFFPYRLIYSIQVIRLVQLDLRLGNSVPVDLNFSGCFLFDFLFDWFLSKFDLSSMEDGNQQSLDRFAPIQSPGSFSALN